MAKPKGIIIYEGKSLIDGKQIVVVVTGWRGTKNPKTGPMLQTWILCKNVSVIDAWMKGKDKSVCGDCKHRRWGTCYVNIFQAPNNVWDAYKRGSYEKLSIHNIHHFQGYELRVGSYGEPAAIPFEIWDSVCKVADAFNGYTHQWRTCDKRLRNICMASVDTEKEAKIAQKAGWLTFRMLLPDEKIKQNELLCPASLEAGKKTTCHKCLACAGRASKLKKNIVIYPHGGFGRAKRFLAIMELKRKKKGFSHLVPNIIRHKVHS